MQDTVQALKQRSEQIVVENEMLYEKLKENVVTDVLQGERSNSSVKPKVKYLNYDRNHKYQQV